MFGKKDKPTTFEEILKAYESLSEDDKANFKQSISAHVDESVAAQEEDTGTEDSQDAKDRIDESEGEKAAETEAEEKEPDVEAETTAVALESSENIAEEVGKVEGVAGNNQIVSLLEAILTALTSKGESSSPEERVRKNVGNMEVGLGEATMAAPDDISMIIDKMKNTK